MQHGEEDGPLDGKLEAAVFEQGGQEVVDRAGLPEPLKDQGWPDSGAASGDAVAPRMGAEDSKPFREASERREHRAEPAASQQFIQAAETKQDALFDLAIHPLVLDPPQIAPGPVALRAH